MYECIHPGSFNKEGIKEERGEDVCTVCRLKEAFEKVDSEKMFECMRERERGISEWLVRKIEE
jgi:hypothetical protein